MNYYEEVSGRRLGSPADLGGGYTHKLEQESVLPESPDAAGKAQHRHDASNHYKQPHRVEASQIGQRRDVGENTLCQGSRGK